MVVTNKLDRDGGASASRQIIFRIVLPLPYLMINSPLTIPLKLDRHANGIFQSFR
jgi:hypothetical protein